MSSVSDVLISECVLSIRIRWYPHCLLHLYSLSPLHKPLGEMLSSLGMMRKPRQGVVRLVSALLLLCGRIGLSEKAIVSAEGLAW